MSNIDPNDWQKNLELLEVGTIRSASYNSKIGEWTVNTLVKQTILAKFKNGKNVFHKGFYADFIDKDNLPARKFTLEEKIRFVSGGSSVRRGAYIAPEVILSKAVPIYDLVNEKVLERGSSIPENAVVFPRSRMIKSKFAEANGLSLNCAIIVKHRDDKSDLSLILEDSLR